MTHCFPDQPARCNIQADVSRGVEAAGVIGSKEATSPITPPHQKKTISEAIS